MAEQETEVSFGEEEGQQAGGQQAGGQQQLPTPSKEDQLMAQLRNTEQESQAALQLARLVADPDIRAILDAKAKGQQVKVGPVEEKRVELPPDDQLENMSNAQLVKYMLAQVPEVIKGALPEVVQPLAQQVQSLQASHQDLEKDRAMQQIQATQAKYPDFGLFIPEMTQISQKVEGLSAEEIYMLAKMRKTKSLPIPQREEVSPASERPTESSGRGERGKTKMGHGARGFSDHLHSVLSRMKFPDGFEEA